ncbi:MAG: methylmalonyl-CoA carboxyltransferase [Chromatiales bacterium]|jgi:acetyl-CoA carboxylase carboxyltransferase component|nr:methylmalonyl-CoA carboxyltransferase [Chromatiales bacterium]
MPWSKELAELREREARAKELGGADKVARQHDGGRLTVRERIDALLDNDSFHEVGALAGAVQYDANGEITEYLPANCVMGRGTIDGRPVVVSGDDFTVRGGSADATIKEKASYPEMMARDLRLPIVRLVEGSGGGGSVKTIETKGRANLPGGLGQASPWDVIGTNLATVPVVGLGLGSVAGLGAARLAASHYSVMVKDTSAVFVAGPPVVEHIGESVTKQELGGHSLQTRAGGVDDAVGTEAEAFERASQFLSYLPSSVHELPPRGAVPDDTDRREESLFSIIPRDKRKGYKMRQVINAVVDTGSFFEMGRFFGRPMITGFARLNGWPVALLASDPMFYAGAWTAGACEKIIRFLDLAETFHLPVVYLADCPGFLVGTQAEKTGVIRKGVRALTALNQTTVPWCTMIVRNAFGIAGGAHRPVGRFSVRYAWLTARWGSLPLEGGIEAAYSAEIEAADDSEAKLEEIESRLQQMRSPYRTAETFWIEEMIDPRDTRRLLCEFADLAAPVRTTGITAFGMRP